LFYFFWFVGCAVQQKPAENNTGFKRKRTSDNLLKQPIAMDLKPGAVVLFAMFSLYFGIYWLFFLLFAMLSFHFGIYLLFVNTNSFINFTTYWLCWALIVGRIDCSYFILKFILLYKYTVFLLISLYWDIAWISFWKYCTGVFVGFVNLFFLGLSYLSVAPHHDITRYAICEVFLLHGDEFIWQDCVLQDQTRIVLLV